MIKVLLPFLFVLVTVAPCMPLTSVKQGPTRIESEAGMNVPHWGIAVDAVYDSRLDGLIPGYKIVNVVVTNRSGDTVYLNPNKDRWRITDSIGKSHMAINHLRLVDPQLWSTLPPGLKEKLEYPQVVKMGHTATIDIFFPEGMELTNFRKISWRSSHFKKAFVIKMVAEKDLPVITKHEEIAAPSARYQQSLEKYEGEEDRTTDPSGKKQRHPTRQQPPFDPKLDEFSVPYDR